MSDHERKFQAAMKELEGSGIWRSNYAPIALRLQRRFGQQARPPHYASFWKTTSGYGFWFAGIWGIWMWSTTWRAQGYSIPSAIGSAVMAGALFGAIIAGYYVWSARKHGLSRWEDF